MKPSKSTLLDKKKQQPSAPPFFGQTMRGDGEAGNIRLLIDKMNQLRVLLQPSKAADEPREERTTEKC
jgi:hypothetical protein